MRFVLLFLTEIVIFSQAGFLDIFRSSDSSTAAPRVQSYQAYGDGGCPSSGCAPPTIVPKTSGFWPNGDILAGLAEQQAQNGQVQRDDAAGNSGLPGVSGSSSGASGASSSSQTPVIYIARAGSAEYKYSENTGNGNVQNRSQNFFGTNSGTQNVQSPFGMTSGVQNQNQNTQNIQNPFGTSSGLQNQNQQSSQNPFGSSSGIQNQNQNAQNPFGTSSGTQNAQNPFGMNSGTPNQIQTAQNPQNPFGASSGSSGFQNQQNSQNPFGIPSEAQNPQSPFGAISGAQNNQNSNSPGNANLLPFGPNLVPNKNAQLGPRPPFTDWNFQPGSQESVHFVGGNIGVNRLTDEAQQIAVQIRAIRDNLAITRDESNYLIGQLKASLPPDLQNMLEGV